jgi:hypothetical protein
MQAMKNGMPPNQPLIANPTGFLAAKEHLSAQLYWIGAF